MHARKLSVLKPRLRSELHSHALLCRLPPAGTRFPSASFLLVVFTTEGARICSDQTQPCVLCWPLRTGESRPSIAQNPGKHNRAVWQLVV